MAHSFRRTPISGNCCARSDKFFKRQAARRLRVAVRGALAAGRLDTLPHRLEIATQRDSAKDGKGWFGDLPQRQRQQLMRK